MKERIYVVLRKWPPLSGCASIKCNIKYLTWLFVPVLKYLRNVDRPKVSPLWNNSVVFSWNHLKITHTRTAKTKILVKIISFSMSNAHTHTSSNPFKGRSIDITNSMFIQMWSKVYLPKIRRNRFDPASQQSKYTA